MFKKLILMLRHISIDAHSIKVILICGAEKVHFQIKALGTIIGVFVQDFGSF